VLLLISLVTRQSLSSRRHCRFRSESIAFLQVSDYHISAIMSSLEEVGDVCISLANAIRSFNIRCRKVFVLGFYVLEALELHVYVLVRQGNGE